MNGNPGIKLGRSERTILLNSQCLSRSMMENAEMHRQHSNKTSRPARSPRNIALDTVLSSSSDLGKETGRFVAVVVDVQSESGPQ